MGDLWSEIALNAFKNCGDIETAEYIADHKVGRNYKERKNNALNGKLDSMYFETDEEDIATAQKSIDASKCITQV